ncbi:SDR family oxidoreductase [Streptomyces sp. MB09-02B]|uniref:SDR family oxidoreductase n=1 Tax=Streptomyces sp. MB09-02B TaxID=3028667 RepID=UPI0029A5CCF8|nr:SDR family oxidoreductase [Streptomyces sp. MB09-02B]MDX3644969.1 SDR family oxidoreductase [Streptomyces sp. MB09-02B]
MTALNGRTALVTGAGRGIGRAVARRLAADGALVAVHYARDETSARRTVQQITDDGGRAFPLQTQFGTPDDIRTLYERFDTGLEKLGEPPALHILVNNAGLNIQGNITDVTPHDFDHLINVHAKAPLFLIQQGLTRLQPAGRIINITSAATRISHPTSLAYTMAKSALHALTHTLAKELGPHQITVNSVAPGYTKTGLNKPRWNTPENEQTHAALSALGRMGHPTDIADIIAFLASHHARWITGQHIDASGGTGL